MLASSLQMIFSCLLVALWFFCHKSEMTSKIIGVEAIHLSMRIYVSLASGYVLLFAVGLGARGFTFL